MPRNRFRTVVQPLFRPLPEHIAYPHNFHPSLTANSPPIVRSMGRLGPHQRPLIGSFCSVRSPGDVILKTYDLARSLRNCGVTIIGGFQSPMEKEFLDLLFRGTVSVVLCPARGLGRMRVPSDWKEPMENGRLLILSFFDDSVRRATTDLAAKRNAYVAALADRILILHGGNGSKTESLARQAIAEGKPVYALDSPDNLHLIAAGASPLDPHDPSDLLR